MEMGDFSKLTGGDIANDSSALVIAAHELKAPLSLIRQLVFELEQNPNINQKQRELLKQIQLISDKSLRLTTNVTKASSLQDSLFESEPINAQQLCEDVAHELWPIYNAHNREIRVNKRRKPPLVIANRDLLYRILLNFGDNSLHYASKKPAEFSVVGSSSRVHIGLRDSGPVTSNSKVSDARPFISGRPHGSGLALALSQRFASAMNGQIGNTKHRDGMTFYVSVNQSVQMSLL